MNEQEPILSADPVDREKKHAYPWLFLVVIVLALATRLFFLTGPLDEPSWRQIWSVIEAREMARENPPDLFNIKVNFRGPQRVSAAPFPFYEALVALVYKATGSDSLFWARLVTLAFYLVSAWYFFRLVKLLAGEQTAWAATAVFVMLPMGVSYSRAVTYEGPLVCCALMAGVHGLLYFRDGKTRDWLALLAVSSVAVLTKPSYAVLVAIPLAWTAFFDYRKRLWRLAMAVGIVLAAGVVLAWLYELNRLRVEGDLVSTLLYPVPHTRQVAQGWYWGALGDRYATAAWITIITKLRVTMATPAVIVLSLGGLAVLLWPQNRFRIQKLGGWLLAGALYVLAVFAMLQKTGHDWWFLPLQIPAAMLAGAGMAALVEASAARARLYGLAIAIVLLLFVAADTLRQLRHTAAFYRDWQFIEAGRVIAQHSAPGDLILCSAVGRSTGWTDPRMLFWADRLGWANDFGHLSEENLATYRQAGVRQVAVLATPEAKADGILWGAMDEYSRSEIPLYDPDKQEIGSVVLFDLKNMKSAP